MSKRYIVEMEENEKKNWIEKTEDKLIGEDFR